MRDRSRPNCVASWADSRSTLARAVRYRAPIPRVTRVPCNGRSSVKERACPQLDVERAPQLEAGIELSAPMAAQPLDGRRSGDEAAFAEELRGEDVGRELAERPSQPR